MAKVHKKSFLKFLRPWLKVLNFSQMIQSSLPNSSQGR